MTIVNGVVISIFTPAFGKMRSREQVLEGEYRSCHTDLQFYSEEISFLRGANWERKNINERFESLLTHLRKIMWNKLYMGTIDNMVLRYASNILGYAILGLPVFGSAMVSGNMPKPKTTDASALTGDYVKNSSL